MRRKPIIDCSDLYDTAAEKLKGLDNDIDKTIQDLAKDIEARGVPRNRVGRQVVKELTAREVLSPSRIYEGLGIEQKRHKKKDIEETFPSMENISTEESSANRQTIQVMATTTGQSVTLDDFNGRSDIKSVSEEQKEKENSELIKKLKSDIEGVKKQLADKTAEASELKRDKEALTEKTQPELFHEIQERFSDEPGLIKGAKLQMVNEAAGKNLVKMLERYNSILNDAVVNGKPIPVGLYVIAKPEMVFVPVRFTVDFGMKRVDISLWEKKLQKPSPSNSVSSDNSKVHS
jgi:hypothetical protein